MRITIAICTWNRSRLLDQTLDGMANLSIPRSLEWEVLVVNNNSDDDTDAVIERHMTKLPLRRLFEPRQGQSNARNCAIEAARGEYIVWTDDDVVVGDMWLAEYDSAFRRFKQCGVFGGPVMPWFEGTPPAWLRASMPKIESAFAVRELSSSPVPLGGAMMPFGANFAIRSSIQREYRYDSRKGRIGNGMLGGDETSVIRAVLEDGGAGRWVPEAKVRHFIPKSRQSIRFLRKYYMGRGAENTLAGMSVERSGRLLFGRPLYRFRQAIVSEARFQIGRTMRPPEVWMEDLIEASKAWGALTIACRPE